MLPGDLAETRELLLAALHRYDEQDKQIIALLKHLVSMLEQRHADHPHLSEIVKNIDRSERVDSEGGEEDTHLVDRPRGRPRRDGLLAGSREAHAYNTRRSELRSIRRRDLWAIAEGYGLPRRNVKEQIVQEIVDYELPNGLILGMSEA